MSYRPTTPEEIAEVEAFFAARGWDSSKLTDYLRTEAGQFQPAPAPPPTGTPQEKESLFAGGPFFDGMIYECPIFPSKSEGCTVSPLFRAYGRTREECAENARLVVEARERKEFLKLVEKEHKEVLDLAVEVESDRNKLLRALDKISKLHGAGSIIAKKAIADRRSLLARPATGGREEL